MFLTIIHHRLRSAWSSPFGCAPDICKVVYCGEYRLRKRILITDDDRRASVTVHKEDDHMIEFLFKTKHLNIDRDKIVVSLRAKKPSSVTYDEPLCDVMESWDFHITQTNVQPAELLSGYRELSEDLFISIADEESNKEYQRFFLYE